jgi:DNA-binding HxlR family transcriptional regulator
MQGQTELILEALGQGDVALILSALVRRNATEAELTRDLHLGQSVATRGLKHLRTVGLVERDSTRSPYRPSYPEETQSLLDALDLLSARIAEARAARDEWLRNQRYSKDE